MVPAGISRLGDRRDMLSMAAAAIGDNAIGSGMA
jgi:hypothetical protein